MAINPLIEFQRRLSQQQQGLGANQQVISASGLLPGGGGAAGVGSASSGSGAGFNTGAITLPDVAPQRARLALGNLPGFADPNFDPAFAEASRNLNRELASLTSTEELGQRRIGEQFTEAESSLGRQREDIVRALRERLASQGILRSGINIEEQGRIGEDYQREIGRIGGEKARALEDLARSITESRTGILGDVESLNAERARQEALRQVELARQQAEREAQERALQEERARQVELQRQASVVPPEQVLSAPVSAPSVASPVVNAPSPPQPAISRRLSGGSRGGSNAPSSNLRADRFMSAIGQQNKASQGLARIGSAARGGANTRTVGRRRSVGPFRFR